jgi:hypothetical protein
MSTHPLPRAAALSAALAFATASFAQEPLPLPLPAPAPDSRLSVLEKGVIHEGFAEPAAHVRGRGVTAPKAPPAPVGELPPEPKPAGEAVKWLPGYWHWDAERSDFVWVCGCYRNVPPDCAWEPGRWKDARGKWAYFPGYWRPAEAKSLPANLPEPPAPKEEVATAPKGNSNAMWAPGVWEYEGGKFEWQPGYWPPAFERMIWQQGQYVAAEGGYAFVPGHWDYPLEERGVLFSPVFFSQAQRERRGWSYRPQVPISFGSASGWGRGGAFDSLSIGPNFNNYYFGDYPRPLPGAEPAAANGSSAVAARLRDSAGDYRPWDAVTPDYTNPLAQHYARLNRAEAEPKAPEPPPFIRRTNAPFTAAMCSTGGSASTCAPGPISGCSTNVFAFMQPTTQGVGYRHSHLVAGDCGPRVVTKNTVAYQHVSRHGYVTTGVVQYHSVSPPIHPGRYGR